MCLKCLSVISTRKFRVCIFASNALTRHSSFYPHSSFLSLYKFCSILVFQYIKIVFSMTSFISWGSKKSKGNIHYAMHWFKSKNDPISEIETVTKKAMTKLLELICLPLFRWNYKPGRMLPFLHFQISSFLGTNIMLSQLGLD